MNPLKNLVRTAVHEAAEIGWDLVINSIQSMPVNYTRPQPVPNIPYQRRRPTCAPYVYPDDPQPQFDLEEFERVHRESLEQINRERQAQEDATRRRKRTVRRRRKPTITPIPNNKRRIME